MEKSTQTQPILYKARSTVEGTGMVKLSTTFSQPCQQRFIDTWRQSIHQEANRVLIFFRVEFPQILMTASLLLNPIWPFLTNCWSRLSEFNKVYALSNDRLYTFHHLVNPWPRFLSHFGRGPSFRSIGTLPHFGDFGGLKLKMLSGLVRQVKIFMPESGVKLAWPNLSSVIVFLQIKHPSVNYELRIWP